MSVGAGRTSCIELPSGRLTVQTELLSDPVQIVTVVDFDGRVVKRDNRLLALEEIGHANDLTIAMHNAIERKVRVSLRQLHTKRISSTVDEGNPTASTFFVMAANAHTAGDHDTALDLLRVVETLLPGDNRVQNLLAEIHSHRA